MMKQVIKARDEMLAALGSPKHDDERDVYIDVYLIQGGGGRMSVGVLEWLFFIFPAASFPGWLESQLILFETAFTFFSLAVVPKSALV